jgi:hypothetical protein
MNTSAARDLNKATETEKAVSIAVIGGAAAVFAGVVAAWPIIVPAVSHTGKFWSSVIIVLALICLAISMIFGGRGCVWGPKRADWLDRFNLQAVFGALAIILILGLGLIIFATIDPSPTEELAAKLGALDARVTEIGKRLDGIAGDLSAARSDLSTQQKAVTNLGKTVDNLTSDSSKQSQRLEQLEKALQPLSDRVQKLETSQPQPKQ